MKQKLNNFFKKEIHAICFASLGYTSSCPAENVRKSYSRNNFIILFVSQEVCVCHIKFT
jgi:hypothetical protein